MVLWPIFTFLLDFETNLKSTIGGKPSRVEVCLCFVCKKIAYICEEFLESGRSAKYLK